MTTGAEEVHVQLIAIDARNAANNRMLWEATGDPMECHYAGAAGSKPPRPQAPNGPTSTADSSRGSAA